MAANLRLADNAGVYFDSAGELKSENAGVSYNLCAKIKNMYNVFSSNCDGISDVDVASAVTSGSFSDEKYENPHIVLGNGLKIYILSDTPAKIAQLANGSTYGKSNYGFTIYVDVNGTAGKSKLYEDIFPFYLTFDGNMTPAFQSGKTAGATSVNHLSVNVIKDDHSTGNRNISLLYSDQSFRDAACKSGYIKSSSYCGSISIDSSCSSAGVDCRFMIKKPIRIF